MPNYTALIAQNNTLWTTAQFKDAQAPTAKAVAAKICKSEAIAVYKKLEALTKVPWWVVGVIHYRECALSWQGNIAQGDPWNRVSIHVPKGRGPFKSFMAAAVDALTNCAPFASKWKDWSPGGALTLLELYNGTGYESHGIPSPYVWEGSQHYRRGKFTSDHHFDPAVEDKQLGCAIILHCMQEMEADVMGGRGEAEQPEGDGPDPNEYPDPTADKEPAEDAPEKPPVLEQVSDKIDQAQEIATPGRLAMAKSLFKSKIAWLQTAAVTAAGGAASGEEGIWAELAGLVHKPVFWCILVVIVASGLTIFFRWKDHGKGAK